MTNSATKPTKGLAPLLKRNWKKVGFRIQVRRRNGLSRRASTQGNANRQVGESGTPCPFRTQLDEEAARPSADLVLSDLPSRCANPYTQQELDLTASRSLSAGRPSLDSRRSSRKSGTSRTWSWDMLPSKDVNTPMKDNQEEQEEGDSSWSEISNPDPFAPVWSYNPFSTVKERGSGDQLASPGPDTSVVAVRRPSYGYGPFVFSSPFLNEMRTLNPMLFLPPSRSSSPGAESQSYPDPEEDLPAPEAERRADSIDIKDIKLIGYTATDEGSVGDMTSSYCSLIPDVEAHMAQGRGSEEQINFTSSCVLGQVLMSASHGHIPVFDRLIHKLTGIVWSTVCDVGVSPGWE